MGTVNNVEDIILYREIKRLDEYEQFIENDTRVKKVVRDYLSGLCNPLQLSTSLQFYWDQHKGTIK